MKKEYKKPISVIRTINKSVILTGSETKLNYVGSNKGTGNYTAESKLFNIVSSDEEW